MLDRRTAGHDHQTNPADSPFGDGSGGSVLLPEQVTLESLGVSRPSSVWGDPRGSEARQRLGRRRFSG